MRNPGWTGAKDVRAKITCLPLGRLQDSADDATRATASAHRQDAIHMQTLMATLEREREELRQQTLRMEEEAVRAREAAERERAAAEDAARRREAGGAGGRGASERGRGIARGSLRGSRGRGGAGASAGRSSGHPNHLADEPPCTTSRPRELDTDTGDDDRTWQDTLCAA